MLALESYNLIFKQLNALEEGQRQPWGNCLSYYSPAFFAFYQFSKLEVKLRFLTLIHEEYIRMGRELLQCLAPLLGCLFAGMDDQRHEPIEKSEQILRDIEAIVGTRIFFGSIWLVCLCSSHCP